jgi:hypothetical protein
MLACNQSSDSNRIIFVFTNQCEHSEETEHPDLPGHFSGLRIEDLGAVILGGRLKDVVGPWFIIPGTRSKSAITTDALGRFSWDQVVRKADQDNLKRYAEEGPFGDDRFRD